MAGAPGSAPLRPGWWPRAQPAGPGAPPATPWAEPVFPVFPARWRCRNQRGLTGRAGQFLPRPTPRGLGGPLPSGQTQLTTRPPPARAPCCSAEALGPRVHPHPPARVPRSSRPDPRMRRDSAPVGGRSPLLPPSASTARGGCSGLGGEAAPARPPKALAPHAHEVRRCTPDSLPPHPGRALWSGVAEGRRVRPPARGSGTRAGPRPWVVLPPPAPTLVPHAARPTQLTHHVGAHHGQRRQVRGAEGREPARVHLGDPGAPEQLVLEEQADLGGGTASA